MCLVQHPIVDLAEPVHGQFLYVHPALSSGLWDSEPYFGFRWLGFRGRGYDDPTVRNDLVDTRECHPLRLLEGIQCGYHSTSPTTPSHRRRGASTHQGVFTIAAKNFNSGGGCP